MIGYAMVGASDLQRSSDYYYAVLTPLGLVQVETDSTYVRLCSEIRPNGNRILRNETVRPKASDIRQRHDDRICG